jgi:hypothetical protein
MVFGGSFIVISKATRNAQCIRIFSPDNNRRKLKNQAKNN